MKQIGLIIAGLTLTAPALGQAQAVTPAALVGKWEGVTLDGCGKAVKDTTGQEYPHTVTIGADSSFTWTAKGLDARWKIQSLENDTIVWSPPLLRSKVVLRDEQLGIFMDLSRPFPLFIYKRVGSAKPLALPAPVASC